MFLRTLGVGLLVGLFQRFWQHRRSALERVMEQLGALVELVLAGNDLPLCIQAELPL